MLRMKQTPVFRIGSAWAQAAEAVTVDCPWNDCSSCGRCGCLAAGVVRAKTHRGILH